MDLGLYFSFLQEKWRNVQAGDILSDELLSLDRAAFFDAWQKHFLLHHSADVRRWYLTLYREFMHGKAVLEVGSGLGFDGITFLQAGAKQWTFSDISSENLKVIRRACEELGLSADVIAVGNGFECFDNLGMYDVIWVNGSLVNLPFELAR